ncbi:MAG: isoprenylcysteine carboxylmethyltransferase family protein [Chloroflexi bacterium]|nr:isoprenylcysteine carboxylmethyltransferase family protein [Chloroflexota bacterium]
MSHIPALGPRGEGWVVLQVVLLGLIGFAGLARSTPQPEPWTLVGAIVGIVLLLAGAGLGLAGISGLESGDALTALPRPRDASRLVDTGAYALVRHPIYGALMLGSIGWALLRGSPAALLGAAGLFVVLDLKRRREEIWLSERYPEYAAYRTRTRRFIPWIW